MSSESYEKTLHDKVFHLPFFDIVKIFKGDFCKKTCQTIMLLYCLPTPVCFSHHDVTKLLGFAYQNIKKKELFLSNYFEEPFSKKVCSNTVASNQAKLQNVSK